MHDSVMLYFEIKRQRRFITAPVDTMGCSVVPQGFTKEKRMLHILVSLLLSSQTKDKITNSAMENLRKFLPEGNEANYEKEYNGLTIDNINASSVEYINKCIMGVGFHNRKAKNLKEIGRILSLSGHPKRIEEVLKLPGIGRKMATLYMNHACGETIGIGVDVHVHRISNRIGLVNSKSARETQMMLERIVPREEWKIINNVLVGFGQTICLKRNPRCAECCVKDKCPSSLF